MLNFFFLAMLIVPAAFQPERGALLAVILAGSLFYLSPNALRYDKTLIGLGIINIAASVLFILNGLLLGAPGALKVATVYVVWPVLFMYFIGFHHGRERLTSFMWTILLGGIVSSFLIGLFIANEFFGLPGPIGLIAESQDYLSGFYDGFIQLHTNNLTTVFYAFTFALTILFLPKEHNPFGRGRSKLFVRITVIVTLLVVIISGRRAFWMVLLLCPLIILVLMRVCHMRIKMKSLLLPIFLAITIIVAAFQVFSLNLETLTDRLTSSFEFNDPNAESNYTRKEQSDALIDGWKAQPILGAGLGATASSVIRNPEASWEYELSYWALLFHTGIVGMLIYVFSVVWIFVRSVLLIRRDRSTAYLLLPQLTGLLCFLVIYASNPYLEKFDYLWVLFLPITTLNALLVNRDKVYENIGVNAL
ncbi:MAG TPA: O-antigen ligase family protein [Dinghuibacter sp.]|uniref:O-antigen ligase family protein n=1 Tax=Dinghuibacter sp. TaxID=2024697 RepID=UPI002D18A247|nr:O-antigen ligase family protein [Dinghuibacter sp.]HTJ10972.1 O-antigen ligase family protein [Dinghuibacter sp.]